MLKSRILVPGFFVNASITLEHEKTLTPLLRPALIKFFSPSSNNEYSQKIDFSPVSPNISEDIVAFR